MALLDDVKISLRLKADTFDGELNGLIEACRVDLKIAGVSEKKIKDDKDPIIVRAINLYCKANFGNSADSEKFRDAYDRLKCSLSLAGDYN